jgi:hypothetical protein
MKATLPTKAMEPAMYIEKTKIIATLRARGLQDRADWVDRTLPQLVDINKNNTLLQMLDIDPTAMSPVEADASAAPTASAQSSKRPEQSVC